MLAAWRESPVIHAKDDETTSFVRFIWLVPTATAAVLVFGAVETGGFALFPIYGARIGYSEADAALLLSMIGLGNVMLQIPMGMLSDRVGDRRHILLGCAVVGLAGTILMPHLAANWHVMAALLFIWGGVVAALYTIGLAHLGSKLSGRDLASANAAFVLCYGLGMVLGPQIDRHRHGPVRHQWLRVVACHLLCRLHRAGRLPHGSGHAPPPRLNVVMPCFSVHT